MCFFLEFTKNSFDKTIDLRLDLCLLAVRVSRLFTKKPYEDFMDGRGKSVCHVRLGLL